jgi:hypothetical protein
VKVHGYFSFFVSALGSVVGGATVCPETAGVGGAPTCGVANVVGLGAGVPFVFAGTGTFNGVGFVRLLAIEIV